MDWPLTVCGLTITWLIGNRKRWAWLLNIALCVAWMAYFVHTRQWGLLTGDLIAIGISVRNYRHWLKP